MKGWIQQKINPPAPQANRDFSDAVVKTKQKAQDFGAKPEVNFASLMANSNAEVDARRAAEKAGDMSGAKNNDEFFQMLEKTTKQQRVPKNTMDKDDFLKLFVTQLQLQDPLNPKDGAAMAAELANFNSLEQMMNINKTLGQLVDNQSSDRTLNLLGYIGKEVQLNHGRIVVEGDQTSAVQFKLTKPLGQGTLVVRDSAGVPIFEKELPSMGAGEHTVPWKGVDKMGDAVPSGVYRYEIKGTSVNGESMPVEISTKTKITGVDFAESGGAFFSKFGKIDIADIVSVGQPAKASLGDKAKPGGKDASQTPNQERPKDVAAVPPAQGGAPVATPAANPTATPATPPVNAQKPAAQVAESQGEQPTESLKTVSPVAAGFPNLFSRSEKT